MIEQLRDREQARHDVDLLAARAAPRRSRRPRFVPAWSMVDEDGRVRRRHLGRASGAGSTACTTSTSSGRTTSWPTGLVTHNSIYKFRGADYRNLMRFEEAFPDATVIVLEQNYRSTQHILDAANAVIANNAARRPKHLWTEQIGGELITRYHAEDEHDEAAYVVHEIAPPGRHRARAALGDVAVFYRTNAQSRVDRGAAGARRRARTASSAA